ncbi:MAG: peptidase domain-containing ABC transporter [Sedimenticola sp.]
MNTQTDKRNNVPPTILSEELKDALRHNRVESFKSSSPFASCLLPLVKALGWHQYARELVEALPHFVEEIDLVDLRNILVTLGYESTPKKVSLDRIQPELFPALFVGKRGQILVLVEHMGDKIRYFDALACAYKEQPAKSIKGTAYLFTDKHPSHSGEAKQLDETWFTKLIRRFQHLLWHLFAMSFLINLVALGVPLFIMMVYDKVIGAGSIEALPMMLGGIFSALGADMALRYLRAKLLGNMAGRMDYLIGVETFKQLLHLPPLFTERSSTASQLSRLKQFDAVRDFFTGPNATLLLELPFVLLFVLVIGLIAGPVALVPIGMLAVYIAFGMVWLPASADRGIRSGRSRNNRQQILTQTLEGRQEIKGVGAESVWLERFREFSGEAVIANYHTTISNSVLQSFAQGTMTVAGVAVITLGSYRVMEGDMSIGALIATLALIWRVLGPIQNAFLSFGKFEQVSNAIKQINRLMTLEVEQDSGRSSLMMSELKGKVSIDRVSFRYGPGQDPALLGVTFAVEPGEMVAVMGQTGSGKSTLIKLIAGMYKPQAGSLAMDEFDIRQLNAMDLRRAIAYVPQRVKLFHGTIAQNMRLNNVLATDDELKQACMDAGILEDILKMPEGFGSRLGDRNTDRLPPGFVRGLSMARAFLRPTQIVLLDEPGASLDRESDGRLMEQLKRLKGSKTVIMVSHRPSHARIADKVVILDQGAVSFIGNPDQAIEMILENAV